MLIALDVQYSTVGARAAGIAFDHWSAAEATREWLVSIDEVAHYAPGEFYRRELPCLIAALAEGVPELGDLTAIVIDGYVWLDDAGRPGLGAHLFEALDGRVPVVGVAKNPFAGASFAIEVLRGESKRPLYVTASGCDAAEAAERVRAMHGPHRIPTLLRRVDALARGI